MMKNKDLDLHGALDQLKPYRIAFLHTILYPACESDALFTKSEVAWYKYPSTGMYCIIGSAVYNLTG